jgi:hypothetical protein
MRLLAFAGQGEIRQRGSTHMQAGTRIDEHDLTWLYPPPAAPPLIPKVGPWLGCLMHVTTCSYPTIQEFFRVSESVHIYERKFSKCLGLAPLFAMKSRAPTTTGQARWSSYI